MLTIENITYSVINGQKEFIIDIFDNDTKDSIVIGLPIGKWDKSTVVNALIRNKYSQDRVEAIVNNHFLNISEWLDKKLSGEEVSFEDPEYAEFQQWRAASKILANQIIESIESLN